MNDTSTTHETGSANGEAYSVGRVARLTGLSPETLRVWERRYGRPTPERLPSGHRRYSAEEVRWLRRVAEALTLGWRPAKAVRASEDELDDFLSASSEPLPRSEAADALLDAVAALDTRALQRHLDARAAELPALELVETVIDPFLRRVGRAWSDGELQLRHEHLAAEVVDDVLRRRRAELVERVPPNGARAVLLTTLPGERHALTLLMLALLSAARGVPHTVLGPDMPLEEVAAAVRETDAQAVAVSVSLSTGGLESDRLLASLGRMLPDEVALLVGGSGVRRPGRGPRRAQRLGSLRDWNRWLEEHA